MVEKRLNKSSCNHTRFYQNKHFCLVAEDPRSRIVILLSGSGCSLYFYKYLQTVFLQPFIPLLLHLKNEKKTNKGKRLTQMGLMSAFVPEQLFECKVHDNKLGEAG